MLRTLPYIALYITRRGITESSPELADVLYQYPAQVGMMLVMMVVMMLMMMRIIMMTIAGAQDAGVQDVEGGDQVAGQRQDHRQHGRH